MRVPRGCRGLRVAEQLADYGEAEASARSNRCESVPKVMDAHALEPGVSLYRCPRLLEVGARPVQVSSRNDEGAAAFTTPQEVGRRPAHDDRLIFTTRLAVG